MQISQSPATPLMDEQVHGDQNRRWTLNNKNHAIFDGCLFLDARRGSGKRAEEQDGEQELDRETTWKYRSIVARGNVLAQDRRDIRYTVKRRCAAR